MTPAKMLEEVEESSLLNRGISSAVLCVLRLDMLALIHVLVVLTCQPTIFIPAFPETCPLAADETAQKAPVASYSSKCCGLDVP